MWQPTQYYHTKMQLAKMELEGKMLSGKFGKIKRKTGTGPILEKLRMLELTEESEEAEDICMAEETAEQTAEQQMQNGETDPESLSEVQKLEQDPETDTDTAAHLCSAEQLQDRVMWAEILGEPVSVKRRKKRMEQIYGNQGHAYRR